MTAPLISVLIPAFNAGRWIAQTLDSALNQTWRNIEIIVVDDGSTDETRAIVERYLSPRVKLVRQHNQGQSAAENRAFRECQGDFIQYLDADDLLSPDKVTLQMRRLEDAPQRVASGEWARFYGTPDEASFIAEDVWRDLPAEEWLLRSWRGGGGMMQAGIWLIPRAVLERAGEWDERLSLINDFEFFTRVVLASDGVRFCPGARLYYRSGNAGSLASQRSPAAWQSALLSLELGTAALLSRTGDPRARSSAADVFQQLAYDAYIDAPAISAAAEVHAGRLGGSRVEMGGGVWFGVLRQTLGWKRAKRVKRLAYRLGYERVAGLKQAEWSNSVAHSDHSRS